MCVKKFIILNLTFAMLFVVSFQTASAGQLKPHCRFNGVYQSEKSEIDDVDCWLYTRFYEDGTVITVSSTGTPVEIARWFKKDHIKHKNLSHGLYKIKDGRLTFSSTSAEGTVDYKGTIQKDVLFLDLHSHINGCRSKRTYRFVQIPNCTTLQKLKSRDVDLNKGRGCPRLLHLVIIMDMQKSR